MDRYFFHLSNIVDPDEQGGLEPGTGVSFIIIPAKKGFQAAAVTVEDPPKPEPKPLETSMANLNVDDTATAEDGWGDDAVTAGYSGGNDAATATADDGWGEGATETKAGGACGGEVAETKADAGWGNDTAETKADDGWGNNAAKPKADAGWGNDAAEPKNHDGEGKNAGEPKEEDGWGNAATDTQADNNGWGNDLAPATEKENHPPAKQAFKKVLQPAEGEWGSDNTW